MPNTRAHGPASTPQKSSMARRIARAVQAVSPLPDFGLASALGVDEDGAAEGGADEGGEAEQHVAPGTPQAGPHEDRSPTTTPAGEEVVSSNSSAARGDAAITKSKKYETFEAYAESTSTDEDKDESHVPEAIGADNTAAQNYLGATPQGRAARAAARALRPGQPEVTKLAANFERTGAILDANGKGELDPNYVNQSSFATSRIERGDDFAKYLVAEGASGLVEPLYEIGIERKGDLEALELEEIEGEFRKLNPPFEIKLLQRKTLVRLLGAPILEQNPKEDETSPGDEDEEAAESNVLGAYSKKKLKKERQRATKAAAKAAQSYAFANPSRATPKGTAAQNPAPATAEPDSSDEEAVPLPAAGSKEPVSTAQLEALEKKLARAKRDAALNELHKVHNAAVAAAYAPEKPPSKMLLPTTAEKPSESTESESEGIFPAFLAECPLVQEALARLPPSLTDSDAKADKVVRALVASADAQPQIDPQESAEMLETRLQAFQDAGVEWRDTATFEPKRVRDLRLGIFTASAKFSRRAAVSPPRTASADGSRPAPANQPDDAAHQQLVVAATVAAQAAQDTFKLPATAAGRRSLKRVQAVAGSKEAFEALVQLVQACPSDGVEGQGTEAVLAAFKTAMQNVPLACLLKSIKIPEPNSAPLLESSNPGTSTWEGGTVHTRTNFVAHAAVEVAANVILAIERARLDGLCIGDGAKPLVKAAFYGQFVPEAATTTVFKFDDILDRHMVALTKSKGDKSKAKVIVDLCLQPLMIALEESHPTDATIRSTFAAAQIAASGAVEGRSELHSMIFGALFTSLSKLWERFHVAAEPMPTLAKAWELAQKEFPEVKDALSPATHKIGELETKLAEQGKLVASLQQQVQARPNKPQQERPPTTTPSPGGPGGAGDQPRNAVAGKARQELRDKMKTERDHLQSAEKAAAVAGEDGSGKSENEVNSLRAKVTKHKKELATMQAQLDAKA